MVLEKISDRNKIVVFLLALPVWIRRFKIHA